MKQTEVIPFMNTKNSTFLVLGGDLRQTYLAQTLAKKHTVYTYAAPIPEGLVTGGVSLISLSQINKMGGVDYLILPLISTTDGVTVNSPDFFEKIYISDLLSLVKKDGLVMGGKIPADVCSFFEKNNIEYIDYFENEELVVKNTTPTAEGALMIALEETPTTIFGSKVLITGYGRVAKTVARLFCAVGAEVYVVARKYSDIAWAEINGVKGIHLSKLDEIIDKMDIVINTVPAVLLNRERLCSMKEDVLVIDLASKPGGVDFESAKKAGIKVIWALSLPGKVAPVSAGRIIADTLQNIITERGDKNG